MYRDIFQYIKHIYILRNIGPPPPALGCGRAAGPDPLSKAEASRPRPDVPSDNKRTMESSRPWPDPGPPAWSGPATRTWLAPVVPAKGRTSGPPLFQL